MSSAGRIDLTDNSLYGTTGKGGLGGTGTVFKLNTNGTAFTNLYSFTALGPYYMRNSDGDGPNSLVLSGSTLYGTAWYGGYTGWGTVFAIQTNGTDFRTLDMFARFDGAQPEAGLILSANTLYGTTAFGGTAEMGNIFAINTDVLPLWVSIVFSRAQFLLPAGPGRVRQTRRLLQSRRDEAVWASLSRGYSGTVRGGMLAGHSWRPPSTIRDFAKG